MPARVFRFVTVFLVGFASFLVSAPAAAAPNAHPVLAYYYAWWDPDNFGRTMYQPDAAYNSDDGAIIDRHVQEAKAAGINGFVMSWYGNGDRTDRNLSRLLDSSQNA